VRQSLILATLVTATVATVDAFAMTRLDFLREFYWYDDIAFIETFPRSSASGNFLALIFAAMGVIVGLLFSISLVAHQVSTERFGETIAPLLFREPLTAFIRSFLVIGSIFVLTNVFVDGAGIYFPFLGTYLSFLAMVLGVTLLPVYVSQSLSLARVSGAAHHLSRDVRDAIRLVSSRRQLGPSVENHLRLQSTTSLSDAQLLIDQLEQKLGDQRGAATVVSSLPSLLHFYLPRRHLVDEDSEWFPFHEVLEQTPYGHSILRDIYSHVASGPPRKQERDLQWLELAVISMIRAAADRAHRQKRLTLFDASVRAMADICAAAAMELRLDLLRTIVRGWADLCARTDADDGLVSSLVQGFAIVIELLVRMDNQESRLAAIAAQLAQGNFDPPPKPELLSTVVADYGNVLRKEVTHEGGVVTPRESIERDLRNAWVRKLDGEPGRMLAHCFDAIAVLVGKLVDLGAASRAQEVALALLVLQRRAVVIAQEDPEDARIVRAAELAHAAYLLDTSSAFQARELLSELVQWIVFAVSGERALLAENLLTSAEGVIGNEVTLGDNRRINGTRTLLAVGGLLKLDAELRQESALLNSYLALIITRGFRREPMEVLRNANVRMFSPAIGGDLMMEFQWMVSEFHDRVDALVVPGTSRLTLNPRLNHPSQLLQSWMPGLNIEDVVDAFLDDLIGSYPEVPAETPQETTPEGG